MILADDTLIDCTMSIGDSSSWCVITPESEEALNDIANSKELTFRLVFDYGNAMTFEPAAAQAKEFKTAAKNIYKYHLPQQLDPIMGSLSDTLYPIIIE